MSSYGQQSPEQSTASISVFGIYLCGHLTLATVVILLIHRRRDIEPVRSRTPNTTILSTVINVSVVILTCMFRMVSGFPCWLSIFMDFAYHALMLFMLYYKGFVLWFKFKIAHEAYNTLSAKIKVASSMEKQNHQVKPNLGERMATRSLGLNARTRMDLSDRAPPRPTGEGRIKVEVTKPGYDRSVSINVEPMDAGNGMRRSHARNASDGVSLHAPEIDGPAGERRLNRSPKTSAAPAPASPSDTLQLQETTQSDLAKNAKHTRTTSDALQVPDHQERERKNSDEHSDREHSRSAGPREMDRKSSLMPPELTLDKKQSSVGKPKSSYYVEDIVRSGNEISLYYSNKKKWFKDDVVFKISILIFFVLMIPAWFISSFQKGTFKPYPDCTSTVSSAFVNIYRITTIGITIFLVYAFRNEKFDYFYIREDLKYNVLSGIIAYIVFILVIIVPPFAEVASYHFGVSTLAANMLMTSFLLTGGLYPVYLSYRDKKAVVDPKAKFHKLEDVISVPEGEEAFREYLKREFSLENFLFVSDVDRFQDDFYELEFENNEITMEDAKKEIKNIYDDYVKSDATFWVNLPAEVSSRITKKVNSIDGLDAHELWSIFDEARKNIYFLMESDTFKRFVRSDLYRNAIVAIRKRTMENEAFKAAEL